MTVALNVRAKDPAIKGAGVRIADSGRFVKIGEISLNKYSYPSM